VQHADYLWHDERPVEQHRHSHGSIHLT
jgi:hypothetical protein